MRLFLAALVLIAAGAAAFLWITRPRPLDAAELAGLEGDATRGEQVFLATGCASCHKAPGAGPEAELVLAGGQEFLSDFGTFLAPNISQHPEHGIGAWSLHDLANAVMRGVSPRGEHYYPALPYASYAKMQLQDVADLYAYMQTLPADPTPNQPHRVGFPFNQRLALGGWKLLFLNEDWALAGDLPEPAARGRYIAEAMAHCGECHTPRNMLGGMDRGRWLTGAPNPSGRGQIPAITPAELGWSQEEIVEYLTTGFTPDYDSASGHMVAVIENLARLPESEREAIAAYLLALP